MHEVWHIKLHALFLFKFKEPIMKWNFWLFECQVFGVFVTVMRSELTKQDPE